MHQIKPNQRVGIRAKISTLWIVVLFNMIYADILHFITPGEMKQIVDGTTEIELSQGLILLFGVLIEIPIIMIILSRVLSRNINRILNIIAAVISIVFIIGLGYPLLHYYFYASIETICMLFIIWYAWKWKSDEDE